MKNSFNEFKNKFEGAKGSDKFRGFIDRLYYSDRDTYGTFCSCIFSKRLRIITGFKKDIPEILQNDFINLIHKTRKVVSSVMNVWSQQTKNFIIF